MQLKALALLFALTALGAAQDIESDDFPQACQDACRDAISLSKHCDDTTEHDSQERDCVCKGTNAQNLLTNCAACSKYNGKNDPKSDLAELMSHCGWSYADATSGSANSDTASATSSGSATSASSATVVTTLSSSGASAVSTVSSSGNPVSTVSSGGSAVVSTMTSAVGGATSSVVPGGAATAAPYVKIGGLVAGLAVGLPVLL